MHPALLALALAAGPADAGSETVPSVDVDRYLGTWYEIASFPQFWQRGCVGTRATYSRNPDGTLRVFNRCHDGTLDGPEKSAMGKAWVVDKASNSKLEVQFQWPFKGDYWIVELGKDYEYAVVGHPRKKYCWVLSRTPAMDEAVYQGIVARLAERGYDVKRLQRNPQRTDEGPSAAP